MNSISFVCTSHVSTINHARLPVLKIGLNCLTSTDMFFFFFFFFFFLLLLFFLIYGNYCRLCDYVLLGACWSDGIAIPWTESVLNDLYLHGWT